MRKTELLALKAGPAPRIRVAVTGIGLICPIGGSPAELLENIRAGRCGIGTIRSFDVAGRKVRHAAEIRDYDPLAHFTAVEASDLNPTSQFAIIAARQALASAGVVVDRADPDRLGLVAGICAGGRGDLPGFDPPPDGGTPIGGRGDLLGCSHYAQTDALGDSLGLLGPRATLSTACASSASALGYAYEWLQSGRVDQVLAGGADAFSPATYAGFYALNAMAARPCSPFSEAIGVTFGEGAGFVVLESLDRAIGRGAEIFGELVGYGTTGDAHHFTSPHPSGEGLGRAMALALAKANLTPDDVDYVNAHGTGTRDNDTAESQAVRELFRSRATPPPMSSTKSFFGHTLGPAGVLEFITSLLAQGVDLIPPTINFEAPRAGCDLDYVPNRARPGKIRHFLSNSSAFGGANAVLLGGRARATPGRPAPRRAVDEVVVTGVGVVSPIGCGVGAFLDSLRAGRSGIGPLERFVPAGPSARHAALVRDFRPRQLAPTIDLRRADPINQYAAVATALALRDAGLSRNAVPDERAGIVMTLAHGPVIAQEKFRESLRRDGLENLSAKYFPAMVVSTIGGMVAQAFGLKATNSTMVEGIGGGLHALVHAFEILRQDDSQDLMVVVAADELGPLLFEALDGAGLLAGDDRLLPYDPRAGGMILGEGAVAVVLERDTPARRRGARPLASIEGCGLTSGAAIGPSSLHDDSRLARAIALSLEEAEEVPGAVDLIYGLARGLPRYDASEMRAFAKTFADRSVPVGCVNGQTGVSEAASGLFGVAAALIGLDRGEAYPMATPAPADGSGIDLIRGDVRLGDYRTALVAGGTEGGNNAAVLFRKPDGGRRPS